MTALLGDPKSMVVIRGAGMRGRLKVADCRPRQVVRLLLLHQRRGAAYWKLPVGTADAVQLVRAGESQYSPAMTV